MGISLKVLSSKEMLRVEKMSFSENKGQEELFMEAAGKGVASLVLDFSKESLKKSPSIVLLCAKGNNTGDAYVAGRYLLKAGYKVEALELFPLKALSPLAQKQCKAFEDQGGKRIAFKREEYTFPEEAIILDGLLGTGFRGEVKSPILELIEASNLSDHLIFSIDIPSGLDGTTGFAKEGAVICATHTIALEFAKSGFFLDQAWNFVGNLHLVSFGLEERYRKEAQATFLKMEDREIFRELPPLKRTRHKYERGSLCVFAGSPGMSGAACLTAHASLRAGAGLVRLFHPESIKEELVKAPVELIKHAYKEKITKTFWTVHLNQLKKSRAFVLGPGMGTDANSVAVLKKVLSESPGPFVLDADALNILAKESLAIPSHSILTPHHGEMCRLLELSELSGSQTVNLDFLKKCQDFVDKHSIVLILKGAPTFILQKSKVPYVYTGGDPGMATAGSGDVLSGILGALLAQGLRLEKAAMLGVLLHGLAGRKAAEEKTSYAMIASDLIEYLPEAYRELWNL